jgi:hypothetical protein
MLTRAYINKVARLMDQIGELRPGFLQDSASRLEGATEPCYPASSGRKSSGKNRKIVRLRVGLGARPSTRKARAARKQRRNEN